MTCVCVVVVLFRRYDLADVVRQALQDTFAAKFQSIQSKCGDWQAAVDAALEARSASTDNYTEHDQSSCAGSCLPADDSGNCDLSLIHI